MALFEEEDRPRRPERFVPARLDGWGVEELRDYITALQEEIRRSESAIAEREKHRGAADALFRRS